MQKTIQMQLQLQGMMNSTCVNQETGKYGKNEKVMHHTHFWEYINASIYRVALKNQNIFN